MDVIKYDLDCSTPSVGGYLSSEQIDLLRIYECDSASELMNFIKNCSQIKRRFSDDDLAELWHMNLDVAKENVIAVYKSTMVLHDERDKSAIRKLLELGLAKDEIVEIGVLLNSSENKFELIRNYLESKGLNSVELIKLSHQIVSLERDQLKSCSLSDVKLLSEGISDVDTILIGSGRIYNVVNPFFKDGEPNKYDFYYTKRDLDYARGHNKRVRYHSLLVKDGDFFNGMSKEQVISELKKYVRESIDFISAYNQQYPGTITAVDLFNELVSFDPMVRCSLDENPLGWREAKRENGVYVEEGEYKNIWEIRYGITPADLVEIFDYALVNKPEGINYLYNEPFLEDSRRREKVVRVLEEINAAADARRRERGIVSDAKFIDTLGSQMHIVVGQNMDEVSDEFACFSRLQRQGLNIQITEFDMSLSYHDARRCIGNREELESMRRKKSIEMDKLSDIISESGVKLDGITYWTIIDKLDHNLERIRKALYEDGLVVDAESIETVCAGRVIDTDTDAKKYENIEVLS